jgi:dienelactone hydrolase
MCRYIIKKFILGILSGIIAVAITGCQTSGVKITTAENTMGGGKSSRLNARLRVPDGEGPFPAVVLMHGCDGWHGGNLSEWATWFSQRGWAALTIDSFTTRGVISVCKNAGLPGYTQRALDAYGGLNYLETLPNINPDRVVVMGFSHGGATVINAMDLNIVETYREDFQKRFIAGIAVYPRSCAIYEPFNPVLILNGDRDDLTPISNCRTALEWYNQREEMIELHVIPNATHAFDMFSWKGKLVGARTFQGYELIPNRKATNLARQIVADFLAVLE